MELLNYSLKDKDIESILRLIIDAKLNLDDFLQLLDENPNWFEDNVNGKILYSTTLEIIEAANGNQKYGILLTYIIEFIEGSDIDDFMFEKIYCYPNDDIRESLLINLAHKQLKENQLRRLCDDAISFECYYELAILYYTEDKYSLVILKNFIEEVLKSKYSYIVEGIAMELTNHHIASNKTKYEYIVEMV